MIRMSIVLVVPGDGSGSWQSHVGTNDVQSPFETSVPKVAAVMRIEVAVVAASFISDRCDG